MVNKLGVRKVFYRSTISPWGSAEQHCVTVEMCCVPVCRGRYVVSMADAHQLRDCVIINGDLAIQLSGSSKLDAVYFVSCIMLHQLASRPALFHSQSKPKEQPPVFLSQLQNSPQFFFIDYYYYYYTVYIAHIHQ